MEAHKLIVSEVKKSEWLKTVPPHLLGALQEGLDYYAFYETQGRVDYLGLVGWMANQLNQAENKYNKLVDDIHDKYGNQYEGT